MVIALGAASAIELMAVQLECEVFSLPTAARVYGRGTPADSIYGVRQGLVEVIGEAGERVSYRPGELFSYQDILWPDGRHRTEAVARTPVELLRLDRLLFLNLLHNHPTLALQLIARQHERLREQRASGSYCY